VNNANVSGHTLLGIISDILDFSKIEAGKLDLETRKTDLFALMMESIDVVRFNAEKKGLELLLNMDDTAPRYAYVDSVRLKQVLANLLSNAVKFTDTGEVELRLVCERLDGGQARLSFSIHDTGIGISASQRDKLFSVFSQADSSTTRKFGGTGLGLTISDMIAVRMGGKIDFISEPGEGTTFFFDVVTAVEDGETEDVGKIAGVRKCLIIDDNASSRTIIQHMLGTWGISCELCGSGREALSLSAASLNVDLILCDYNMPGLDGLETIRQLGEQRGVTPNKQSFILLHSSMESENLYRACSDLGIQFRMTKPVNRRTLFELLSGIQASGLSSEPRFDSIDSIDSIDSRQTLNREIAADVSEKTPDVNTTEVRATGASDTTSDPTGDVPRTTGDVSGTTPTKPRILIAEDVHMNMLLLKAILKSICPAAELFEATNGIKAVEQYSAVDPDLIFMDVQMPELDGLNATVQIRTLEASTEKHVPIVALTAGVMKEEKDQCFDVGMDYFLTKPVEAYKIKEILKLYQLMSLDSQE